MGKYETQVNHPHWTYQNKSFFLSSFVDLTSLSNLDWIYQSYTPFDSPDFALQNCNRISSDRLFYKGKTSKYKNSLSIFQTTFFRFWDQKGTKTRVPRKIRTDSESSSKTTSFDVFYGRKSVFWILWANDLDYGKSDCASR